MSQNLQNAYTLRDSIMNALSDEEISRVSNAESVVQLANGEEYLDLAELEQGVRKSIGVNLNLNNAITRKAVHQDTWNTIVSLLAGPNAVTMATDGSPTPRNA